MGTLTPFGTSPFDILFRNFFDNEGEFAPFNQIRVNHPVDIYEDDNGLCIDIACVGLDKKDKEKVKTELDKIAPTYDNFDKKTLDKRLELLNLTKSQRKKLLDLM